MGRFYAATASKTMSIILSSHTSKRLFQTGVSTTVTYHVSNIAALRQQRLFSSLSLKSIVSSCQSSSTTLETSTEQKQQKQQQQQLHDVVKVASSATADLPNTSKSVISSFILSSSLPFGRHYPPLGSSSIGTDVEMIAANHRISTKTKTQSSFYQHSVCRTYTSTPSVTSEMKDEYGTMDSSGHIYKYDGEYVLENGQILPEAEICYQTYGTLNETTRDNVLVICHALTGNASLHSWWGTLLGPGKAFDTNKYFIVCCNILGSCYGSTNPTSINPLTNQPYGVNFPDVSVQDTVRLQLHLLQNELNINSVKCVIGGSFGGMQSLEYAVQGASTKYGSFFDLKSTKESLPYVKSCIPIACGTHHTAWQIGISEVQRQAIYKDLEWQNGQHSKATSGLEIARQIGMISYRTASGYVNKFGRNQSQQQSTSASTSSSSSSSSSSSNSKNEIYGTNAKWDVKTYLEYQGSKFLTRFDPITYVKLTEQLDSHNIARGRCETIDGVLQTITVPCCVLGIDSDILYPIYEQEQIAQHLVNGTLHIIHSIDGHDGFLLEQGQVSIHIQNFLNTLPN